MTNHASPSIAEAIEKVLYQAKAAAFSRGLIFPVTVVIRDANGKVLVGGTFGEGELRNRSLAAGEISAELPFSGWITDAIGVRLQL
jgi:hypothetical protein